MKTSVSGLALSNGLLGLSLLLIVRIEEMSFFFKNGRFVVLPLAQIISEQKRECDSLPLRSNDPEDEEKEKEIKDNRILKARCENDCFVAYLPRCWF